MLWKLVNANTNADSPNAPGDIRASPRLDGLGRMRAPWANTTSASRRMTCWASLCTTRTGVACFFLVDYQHAYKTCFRNTQEDRYEYTTTSFKSHVINPYQALAYRLMHYACAVCSHINHSGTASHASSVATIWLLVCARCSGWWNCGDSCLG